MTTKLKLGLHFTFVALALNSSCVRLEAENPVAQDARTFILSPTDAQNLFSTGTVYLSGDTYVLPSDFTINLGAMDLNLIGVPGKTIITSYDGESQTEFRPTPLDTTLPDSHPDGLYVVVKHPSYSYGGGFAHIELTYNTDGSKVYYTQGTILKKQNGVWSRHYSGNGFVTAGNVSISGVTFQECAFYLFSPFGFNETQTFEIKNSRFNNVSRVLSSSLYGGINHSPNWNNALNYYPVDGSFRFSEFTIDDSVFENIHTSIIWGFPPSRRTRISRNTIKGGHAIAFFNLFMKNYSDAYFFNTRSTQSIESNVFLDIVQNNNWTTQLIRTSGIASIANNYFINTTPQIALIYGGDTNFIHNRIVKSNPANEMQSPVVLVKSATPAGSKGALNTFKFNTVVAPNSFFLAVEGASSAEISANNLNVKTVYSKNDSTPGDSQYLNVTQNNITAPALTNINSNNVSITYESVVVDQNVFKSLSTFHTGSTPISVYEWTNNRLVTPSSNLVLAVAPAQQFISSGNTNLSCPTWTACLTAPNRCVPTPMIDESGCVQECGSICI